ncbi:MAG: hypothetical protein K9N23_06740 [Akkermansiaceae bacterium]|nr:hypothetical protein [Akkermansiaceae bacterium]
MIHQGGEAWTDFNTFLPKEACSQGGAQRTQTEHSRPGCVGERASSLFQVSQRWRALDESAGQREANDEPKPGLLVTSWVSRWLSFGSGLIEAGLPLLAPDR